MSADEDAYNELCCYTLTHNDPAFIHQHVVDAFAVQKADETTKPIKLTFGLIGLYLKIERSFPDAKCSGRTWRSPGRSTSGLRSPLPDDRGAMTAVAVMEASPGVERDQAIDRWCASVWAAFSDSHSIVAESPGAPRHRPSRGVVETVWTGSRRRRQAARRRSSGPLLVPQRSERLDRTRSTCRNEARDRGNSHENQSRRACRDAVHRWHVEKRETPDD